MEKLWKYVSDQEEIINFAQMNQRQDSELKYIYLQTVCLFVAFEAGHFQIQISKTEKLCFLILFF